MNRLSGCIWSYFDFLFKREHMKKLISIIIFTFAPMASYADDTIISEFTKSISKVYSTSKSCENTIGPGPKEYIEFITDYYEELYPNGTSYWIIPQSPPPITNPDTCITMMRTSLFNYKTASEKYLYNYPNRKRPPVLVLYQWDSAYFEMEPPPVKSYLPSSKKKPSGNAAIKKKFGE